MSSPQRPAIELARVRERLGPGWARFEVVAETTSTNAELLADDTAPDHSVLVAEFQASGRGRLGRQWSSPARAGLLFSVRLEPNVPIATWGWLPLLAGVAVREAVVEVSAVSAALKWPNDLLAAATGQKLAGILAQTSGSAVVIGVGLNVTSTAAELPVDTATSLALAGAVDTDRDRLLAAILSTLDERYQQWSAVGGDAEASGLAATYRRTCATIGQLVTVTATDASMLRGTAVGVDGSGRLQLDVDGVRHVIGAGDVEHLRPAT